MKKKRNSKKNKKKETHQIFFFSSLPTVEKKPTFFLSNKMTQKTNIYNTRQFNELIQGLTKNNTVKTKQILLPQSNVPQYNPININTSTGINFQGVPENIQFQIENSGYINSWNSPLIFNLEQTFDFTAIYKKGLKPNDDDLKFEYDLKVDIVELDNFVCLKLSGGFINSSLPNYYSTVYIRYMQIPPTPQAWLDNVILQKNNKGNNPFNSYYWDIFRKQCVSNQLISQDYTSFNQENYACINGDGEQLTQPGSDYNKYAIYSFKESPSNEKVLASYYLVTTDLDTLTFKFNYPIEIPLAYFHPFFQMQQVPMELLNDNITMIMNFNKYIFSSIYCFDKYKPLYLEGDHFITVDDNPIEQYINISFTSINDIQIVLSKDTVLKNRKIEPDKYGSYYITYRNSGKSFQKSFDKQTTPAIVGIIPKLASLDIIQLSTYDSIFYSIDGTTKNDYDYYLGYSHLFNSELYTNQKVKRSDDNHAYWMDQGFNQLQSIYTKDTQLALDLPFITFGNVQIQIGHDSIIKHQYPSLQNIYQNNMSIYDFNDNKQPVNNSWTRDNYLKYWNCYLYKFDQQFGTQDELRSANFQGLETDGSSSQIFIELYNYNKVNPSKIDYQANPGGVYNNWLSNPAFYEVIYYYTSLFLLKDGDLVQIQEERAQEIIEAHKHKIRQEDDAELIDNRIRLILKEMNKQEQKAETEKAQDQIGENIVQTETVVEQQPEKVQTAQWPTARETGLPSL